MKACRGIGLVVALVFGACGFDRNSNKDTLKQVSSQVEELTRNIGEFVAQTEVPEEFKKLQQFEYQVFTLPFEKTSKEMEAKLNELGKERWDCFHFERRSSPESNEIQVFCKRRPDTPLKYVPKTFIGG